MFIFPIGVRVLDHAGLDIRVDTVGLSGIGDGCDGLGVLDGMGLQALCVLLVCVGLELLQVGEGCDILIAGGYIEGRCVLAGTGLGDH